MTVYILMLKAYYERGADEYLVDAEIILVSTDKNKVEQIKNTYYPNSTEIIEKELE